MREDNIVWVPLLLAIILLPLHGKHFESEGQTHLGQQLSGPNKWSLDGPSYYGWPFKPSCVLRTGIPNTLMDIVDWLVLFGMSKVFKNLVLHSTLAAAVYGIWIERNTRVFQGLSKQVDVVSLNVCSYSVLNVADIDVEDGDSGIGLVVSNGQAHMHSDVPRQFSPMVYTSI
ncbi:hypothetical protein RHSIM_Rhsim04G0203800 [Rhododendron simsii]|uniref:Uncharacterized protein n=1 Tax=Rhododendron simsii TaxID=118357 RepID=A0A834LSJ6_RHOSS|nr:hypothetical protein RHSIM_Rhsim04G0203800 [Rhododendron simsii]